MSIRDEEDLNRANIQLAWSFAWRMTSEEYDQLCRVTVEQMRRDVGAPAPELVTA